MSDSKKPSIQLKRQSPGDAKQGVLEKGISTAQKEVGGDFVKLTNDDRKQQLLRSTPHGRHASLLWTKDRSLTKKFFVKRYMEYTGMLECEFSGRASKVMEEVDRELDLAGGNDIYFNLKCDESTLFFRLNRRDVRTRDGLLLIELPSEVFEVQRRAQLRYRVSEVDAFTVASAVVPKNAKDLRILDFSAGGLGIQIRFATTLEADAFRLEPDSRSKFSFLLGEVSLTNECEIRYCRRVVDEIDGSPAVRIGLRMVGLAEATVESIQNLVLELSYQRFKDMQSR